MLRSEKAIRSVTVSKKKEEKKKLPHRGDIVRHALHVSLTASSFRKCLKRRLGFKCHDRRDQAKRTVFIF